MSCTKYNRLLKLIDGLTAIVKEEFELAPFSLVYFFCNYSHNKLTTLVWDNNGL
ncbi:hypothetical protein COO04_09310 [Bacillus toyonensis]|uniref:IS66 family insertion sequence element accessory protein TnpB n=1 Tax=Bacillus cereus group TaxID=86661 RepID=UPI000A37EBEC|nr:hypothetical protein COO04_09310 [Bacillus toyonensis]PFL40602.1 hypothetical protein COJ06_10555 [Bacillus cereus]